MTVQVDSQPVTDQNMWNIDMCCINNSISCLEKKTTLGTHEQTSSMLVCPSPLLFISEVYPSGALVALVYFYINKTIKIGVCFMQVVLNPVG